jgi:VWFA-related protein
MTKLTQKTFFYGAAGALGGACAWAFVLAASHAAHGGKIVELALGGLAGMFIGGFIWSHEAITGRQAGVAVRRAAYGAAAGLIGGAAGALLGSTLFTRLGVIAAESGGLTALIGIALSVALGWAVLGAAVGLSGGIMTRSRARAGYGFLGGALGGLVGGLLFNQLSATSIWSALAGLTMLGMFIGAFISLVEEAFVAAKLKVVKGRHVNREFPLLKDLNVVGRDDRSDVCLSGAEGVSLRHAVIKRKNGRFVIESDEQGKAVYVNQTMTRKSVLADGDIIRVGGILLLFSATRKAAAAALVLAVLALGAGIPGFGARTAVAAEAATAQITQFDVSNFPIVKAYVSVLDADGKPVRGIEKADLTLTENNSAIPIDSVGMAGKNGAHEPLSIAVVLDRSESMAGKKLERAKESALRFVSLMEPGDRAAILAFSDKVAPLAPLSDSQDAFRNAVIPLQAEGHTALYDAAAAGVEALRGISGRRAVIVLTDGIANRGALDIGQAIESAKKANVSITVIGLGADVRTARLERIADETGGNYFFAPSADDLMKIYETISSRIRNEYAVTYRTAQRGEYLRNVTLSLAGGPVAARGYFQPESSLFGAAGELPGWAFVVPLLCIAGLAALSLRKIERHYKAGHLSLVRGQGTKKELDIASAVTIGRDERNVLGLFRDGAIEQRHAEVVKENGRYVIVDKGSSAGTFVNKKQVAGRQALEDGDVIDVGNATIVFSEEHAGTCPGCGEPVRAGAKFCAKCGLKAA